MPRLKKANMHKNLIILLSLLAFNWSVFAKTYVIKGEQTIWFEITNSQGVMDIPTYKSYSFTQEVVENSPTRKVVKVHSLAVQLNSSIASPIPVG